MRKRKKNPLTVPVNEYFQSKDSIEEEMKQKLVKEVIEAIEVRRKLLDPKVFQPKGKKQ
jgi:hypothetical protein